MAAIFEIANEDYELAAIPNSGGIGNPQNFSVTPELASKMQLNGKKTLVNQLQWTVNPGGCTMPGCTHVSGASVPDSFQITSQKCEADQKPVLLKLDMGDCNGQFANNANGATVPCSCKIMIKNAGQTKVKGE